MLRPQSRLLFHVHAQLARLAPVLGCAAMLGAISPLSQAQAIDDWEQIPGAAMDIGAGGGRVWIVGTDEVADTGYGIYRYSEDPDNPWHFYSNHYSSHFFVGATRIAVDAGGHAWIVDADSDIYRIVTAEGERAKFLRQQYQGQDIAAGSSQFWCIGTHELGRPGYNIAYRDDRSGDWERVPGAGIRVALGRGDNAWVINGEHKIYRFNGEGFQRVKGTAKEAGVGGPEEDPEQVFVVGANEHIYRWTGGTGGNPWVQVADPPENPVHTITVDDEGRPWVICGPDNHIYRGQ